MVANFALEEHFFKKLLERQLLHGLPCFHSPVISARVSTAKTMAVNRGNRTLSPYSVSRIHVKKTFELHDERGDEYSYIFSQQKLVVDIDTPASKYMDRPDWEHEYLILKRVPAEAIDVYELVECIPRMENSSFTGEMTGV